MNITTDKQNISKVLSALRHVVPQRAGTSVDDTILVNEALSATDFYTYARLRYPHEGQGEGVFPFSGLKAACKGKGPIALGIYDRSVGDGTSVHVAAGGKSWPGGDVSAWPIAPKVKEGSPSVAVVGQELHEVLSLGSIALAAEEGRYLFDHVLIDVRGGRLSIVSTDGRRMSVATIEAEGQDGRVLVSPAAVKILKYLSDVPEGVRLTWDGTKLFAESSAGEAWFTTRDDAAFPDFRPHMDKPRTPLATVTRRELLAACEGAYDITTEDRRAVEFTFGLDALKVDATYAGTEYHGVVPSAGVRGAHIYMNPLYLADGLKATKAETVTLFASELVPEAEGIIIESGSMRYLVMPILVDEQKQP